MAITKRVQTQLSNVLPSEPRSTPRSRSNKSNCQADLVPAALAPAADTVTPANSRNSTNTAQEQEREDNSTHQNCNANCSNKGKTWTPAEHERFVQALQLFPTGPWKAIATVIGTKTPRQTMTHAQKCRQKLERHQRGLKIQTRRLVESRQQQQQRLFPSQNEQENTERLQPLPIHHQEPPPHRNVLTTTAHENASSLDRFSVVHPAAINGASRDDAALTRARSHVTLTGADDARYLTLLWGDAHGRAQEQAHHHQHQQQQVLQSHHDSMEMVSDFAVLGAFENTYSSSMM